MSTNETNNAVTRELIEQELDTTFGKSIVGIAAKLKGLTEEQARELLIEEALKQEAEYQARQAEFKPIVKLELDEQMARVLARKLSCRDDRDCGFDREEKEALYDLYATFCEALEGGGGTICPDGTSDVNAYIAKRDAADTQTGPAVAVLSSGGEG